MEKGNRDRLVEAGIELLSEKTFSEISMDQVAERSGVSKPMIYYYFKNKEGYYRGLAEHLLKMARESTKKLYDPSCTLREMLERYVRFRIDYVSENPGIAGAFLSIIHDPNIGHLINELQEQFDLMRMEFVDPMFDAAVARGEIGSSVNRMIVMMMLNSVLVAITMKMLNGICSCGNVDPVEVVDIIFDGISEPGRDG